MGPERVRLRCTATGVDIGGGWGLYVSAQDNDLGVDRIDPDGAAPWDRAPIPTSYEAAIARVVVAALTAHKPTGDLP